MANEHYSTIGAEYRKESLRLQTRVLFLAFALMLSHLLEIKPSDFEVGGLRILIKDPIVIRGTLASIFIYYLGTLIDATFQGSIMLPIRPTQVTLRYLFSVAKRPYKDSRKNKMRWRSTIEQKRYVWWSMTAYLLVMMPLVIACLALVSCALLFGIQDAWAFTEFAWSHFLDG